MIRFPDQTFLVERVMWAFSDFLYCLHQGDNMPLDKAQSYWLKSAAFYHSRFITLGEKVKSQ